MAVLPSNVDKIVFALCSYEAVALLTPLPTITSMQRRFPILGAGLVTVLAAHFVANDDLPTDKYLGWLK